MDTNLVKWGGVVSEAGRKMDTALEKMRRHSITARPVEKLRVVVPVSRVITAEILDLPRICAVHNRGYVARYIRGDKGNFCYGQTIRVTDAICDQYSTLRSRAARCPAINARRRPARGAGHEDLVPFFAANAKQRCVTARRMQRDSFVVAAGPQAN
jgi:hypothetical protein